MRSGYPYSQPGDPGYPALEHQSDVGTLTSPQDNNVAPEPVLHPANGIPNNKVATHYPGELRVAHSPAQWQQGNTQSQQNFQGLPQLESQPSMACTGFQHSKPRESVCSPQTSHYGINRKAYAHFSSSAHASAQHSSYFGTSANENSVRQSVRNGRQQNERFKRKGTDLNINSGLLHKQLCAASSVSTSSAALQGESLGVTTQESPLQDQCSVPDSKQKSCPLLRTLLKGNSPDFFFTRPSSSSKETNANIELTTSTHFSDEMHLKSPQVKSSLAALNCGKSRTQNLDHLGGTHSTECQQQVSSCSSSSQPSMDKVSPVGEKVPCADDQIQHFIAKTTAYIKSILVLKNANDRDSTLQSDYVTPKSNSVAHLPTTSAHNKEDVDIQRLIFAVIEQASAAVGQALEEDSSKDSKANAVLTPKSKEMGDCATSGSKKHSTEYPQIMEKVAATCTKNEDESPVVLTALSGMTFNEMTEKHTSLLLNCSSSQQEYKPLWLNIDKNLDDKDQMSSVSGLKPVEAVRLDNVQGVTDAKSGSVLCENKSFGPTSLMENQDANTKKIKNIEDQHCGVACKDKTAHSKLNLPTDKSLLHSVSFPANQSERMCKQTSCDGVRVDVASVHSQTDVSMALSETTVRQRAPLSERKGEATLSLNILRDPQYEDISGDEDMSQPATKLPKTEHEELRFPACIEDQQYEHIGKDGNPHVENEAVERPSVTQVPETNNKHLTFENESYGQVQGQAQMKTEFISDEELIPKKQVSPKTESLEVAQNCFCSCSVETRDGLECLLCPIHDSKRHLRWPTNHSDSFSPTSVLKDEADDQTDDDEWLVIPLNVSDLKFEPVDEDQDSPEKVMLDDGEMGDKETQCDTSPVPDSALSQMEVFDTFENFLQAKSVQFNKTVVVASNLSTPECELDSVGEQHKPQNRRESCPEPDDSSETEDSCDYSSGSERNYLTVSRDLLKKSAPLPLDTDDSMSGKESEDDDEVKNRQKGQAKLDKLACMTKLRQLMESKPASKHIQHKTNRQKTSEKDDVIILNSDTEDESDQTCKKKAKRKKLCSLGSDDSGAVACSQQERHPPETVDSPCGTVKEKFQVNAPAPQLQSKLHELMQETCTDQSHSTEKTGQLIESKDGSECIIILDSEEEDDNHQNYKKAKSCSASTDNYDAACVHRKIRSPETVDTENGNTKEKPTAIRLSFADSSLPQHQSKPHDTQFNKVMKDACSELSHSTEKRQLIEAKGGSDHVQHETNRQMMSEERRNRKRIISSGSEDSGYSSFAKKNRPLPETVDHLCETANTKPKNPRLSSEDSPKEQRQSVGKETGSTLDPNPVIPRFVVQTSSQHPDQWKLMNESRVHVHANDETLSPKTPAGSSKNTDCSENSTQCMYRNKKGRFISKPKPANDTHCSAKNRVQAKAVKPGMVSRQLSLPATCTNSSSFTRGELPEARQSSSSAGGLSQSGETSTSGSLPKSKQYTSITRQSSSKPHLSRSSSNPSASVHPRTPTKDPPSYAAVPSARKQVKEDWERSYYSTRRDRTCNLRMEENVRTTYYDSSREARPGPNHCDRTPRQRHNSQKSVTPLMKKTKFDAVQLTRAKILDISEKKRYPVGDNYKWSEKSTVAKPRKGSSR